MSNRPARASLADINRAAKAAVANGCRVEVKPDGTIVLVPQMNSGQSGDKQPVKLAEPQEAVSDDEFSRRLAEIKGGKRADCILQRP